MKTVVDTPPFQISETGWGGFNVEIRLFFAPESLLKPEYRTHFLQLEKYGDDAQQALQEREKLVRSEFLEYAEFNEPTEAFYDALTDEAQWGVKREKGKGRGKRADGVSDVGEGTVVLQEGGRGFGRLLEQEIVDMLRKAEKEVEAEIEAVAGQRRRLAGEMREVRGN